MQCVRRLRVYCMLLVLCASCIDYATAVKCVLNPYYKPICGTDGKTYGNKDLLNCYNRQRPRQRQIRPHYHRECEPLVCPSYQDLQGTWPSVLRGTPICGNNGYTYGHIHQVRCLKDFMPNLEVMHEGGCALYEVRKALGNNVKKKACAIKRINFEQNAICTKHNVTYQNPFKALCAMRRGLREKVGGVCGCPFQRSCEKAHELQQSLRSAPINERTKFVVCGSDWRTYRSRHHLECSRRYNSYLYMIHRGRCKQLEEPCPDTLKFIRTPSPVCGSDDKSYVSYDALICAQFRISKGLKYIHSGACIRKT